MITDIQVVHVECQLCKALIGEPCFRMVRGKRSYSVETHAVRRFGKPGKYDKPKLRLTPEEYGYDYR